MFAINSCQSLADNYSFLLGFHTALHIKTGLLDMLYQKSLRLTVDVRNARGVGTVVNLQSNDASKVWMMPVHIHTLWNSPFQVMIFLTTSCDLLISQLCSLAVVLDPSLVSLLSLPDVCVPRCVTVLYCSCQLPLPYAKPHIGRMLASHSQCVAIIKHSAGGCALFASLHALFNGPLSSLQAFVAFACLSKTASS